MTDDEHLKVLRAACDELEVMSKSLLRLSRILSRAAIQQERDIIAKKASPKPGRGYTTTKKKESK